MCSANYVVPYVAQVWSGTLPSKIGGSKVLVVHRDVFDFTDKTTKIFKSHGVTFRLVSRGPPKKKALLQTEDGNQSVARFVSRCTRRLRIYQKENSMRWGGGEV